MPTFVHITSEDTAKKAKRGGIQPAKPSGRPLRGVFAMPVTPSFQFTHQWVREVKQWRRGMMVGVYFRIPDSELVWAGHYNEQLRQMTAAHAAAHVMSQTTMTACRLSSRVGSYRRRFFAFAVCCNWSVWRHYPDAHGKQPWSCPCCQRDAYGSRKIREWYAERSA